MPGLHQVDGAQIQTILRNIGSTAAAVISLTGTGALQLLFSLAIALSRCSISRTATGSSNA